MNKIFTVIKDFYKKYSDIVVPTAVLFIICIAVTLALSSTNLLTEGPIAKITEENNRIAMEKVIKAETYAEGEINGEEYHIAKNGEEVLGYIFMTSDKGYGGDVGVMTAVDTEGKIIAVEILDVSGETPGLGQNAAKQDFYKQFADKSGETSVVKNGADPEKGQVDAVTGATITSKAVSSAVNQALDLAKQVIEGGAK